MDKEFILKKFKSIKQYIFTFIKWIVVAGITGALGGIIGSIFHISVEHATEFRLEHDWIIFLLPIGGIVIVYLYTLLDRTEDMGTNLVINSIRTDGKVPFVMAPLIFISTVITHLCGGSAGREGAALQLGGSIGSQVGKLLRLDEKDMHLITLCGMSGVFAALFGTPLTATFFSMEVISVGIIYYSSFIPCIVSSLIAYKISIILGLKPVAFTLKYVPDNSFENIIKVSILGVMCAVVSIIFCKILHESNFILSKFIKNNYCKIIFGGIVIVGLTFLLGTRDYNGAGMDIIENAINGQVKGEAFILKMIFTAITIGAGYKGGEIVPTFFVGSTFGCAISSLIGLNPGFGAAIGLVALFCGVVNTPITSIILSIELFGSEGLILFAIASGVSYMLSGYYSLYSSQKIVYSKLRAEFINKSAK